MNHNRTLLKTALLSGLTALHVGAQTANDASVQQQLDALTQTVKELKDQIAADKKASEERKARILGADGPRDNFDTVANTPVTGEDLETSLDVLRDVDDRKIGSAQQGVGVRLGGNATVRYTQNRADPNTAGSNQPRNLNGFSLATAGINISGSLRSDPVKDGDVTYRYSYVFSGPSIAGTTSYTQDAYINWAIISRNKNGNEPFFTVDTTIGQQSVFFGNEVVSSEELRPTINAAPWAPPSGGPFAVRDIGATVKGGINWNYDASAPSGQEYIPTFAYELGYFNGNGVAAENNNNKATLAKLVYTPFTRYNQFFQGLKFGYSRLDWKSSGTGPTGSPVVRNNLNAVHAEWLKLPFLYTAEYIWGDRGDTGPSNIEGYQLTAFYRPGKLPDFEPLVRFESYKPWGSAATAAGADRTIWTVGFNYYWYQVDPTLRRSYQTVAQNRVLKLQVNYRLIDLDHPALAPSIEDKPNQFQAQLVFSF